MRWLGELLNEHFEETFTIVGKGPTTHRYELLDAEPGPIIYLNDAVQIAVERTAYPSYWFAHDMQQRKWMRMGYSEPGLKAGVTPVLPLPPAADGKGVPMLSVLDGTEDTIAYGWHLMTWVTRPWDLLADVPAEHVARTGNLYLNSGVIHPAIHFAWMCGAKSIRFIGCDGQASGDDFEYDERLATDMRPSRVYAKIKRVQEWMCDTLELERWYVGTVKRGRV